MISLNGKKLSKYKKDKVKVKVQKWQQSKKLVGLEQITDPFDWFKDKSKNQIVKGFNKGQLEGCETDFRLKNRYL